MIEDDVVIRRPFTRFSTVALASTPAWIAQTAPQPWPRQSDCRRPWPSLASRWPKRPDSCWLGISRPLHRTYRFSCSHRTSDSDIEKQALSFGVTAVFARRDDLAALVENARAVCGIE